MDGQYSIMQSLMNPGAWFRFPKGFLKIMSRDEALVLSFLANHAFVVKCHERKGWFFCRMVQMMAELNISSDVQTRLMGNLERRGFILTRKKGMPAKRWIYIDWLEVEKKLRVSMALEPSYGPDENDNWEVEQTDEFPLDLQTP